MLPSDLSILRSILPRLSPCERRLTLSSFGTSPASDCALAWRTSLSSRFGIPTTTSVTASSGKSSGHRPPPCPTDPPGGLATIPRSAPHPLVACLPVEILGIPVSPALLSTWRGWLMPKGQQPFVVPDHVAHDRGLVAEPQRLTMEFQDSFCIYGDDVGRTYWLTRAQSRALPPAVRADQPAPHRWPSANVDGDVARVVRFVSKGRRCSRHAEVPASAWRAAGGLLPEARQLAGRFPNGSGPNCFGTVMAAAGVGGSWDLRWEVMSAGGR